MTAFFMTLYIQKIVYLCKMMRLMGYLASCLLINFVAIKISNTYASGAAATCVCIIVLFIADNVRLKVKK